MLVLGSLSRIKIIDLNKTDQWRMRTNSHEQEIRNTIKIVAICIVALHSLIMIYWYSITWFFFYLQEVLY